MIGNEKTFYVLARSKRSARRAANADWRWYRTWFSDKETALGLLNMPQNSNRYVYSFKVRADIDSVELVKRE